MEPTQNKYDPVSYRHDLRAMQSGQVITYSDCRCCGRYMAQAGTVDRNLVCAEQCGGPEQSRVDDHGRYPHSFIKWCEATGEESAWSTNLKQLAFDL